MAESNKTPIKPTNFLRRKFRGLSLLEAMLALAIGGIVITQSIFGLSEYTSGIQVQGAASKISILNRAADRFAEDNFAGLVAAAPREYPISVLEPYTGPNIGEDALGNRYKITTRTYPITVPNPSGGTMTETALQVLIVGEYADPASTPMIEDLTLRSDVANTAGSAAGFVAIDELTCPNGAGGVRGNGDICGAFGAYSFDSSDFPATNFSNAAIVSLITKGDSTVYGDQLYRYDYGDPELNTMHTDIHMGDNDLDDVGMITKVTGIDLDGGSSNPAVIRSTNGKTLRLEGNSDTVIRSNNGQINLNASNNVYNLAANVTGPACTGPTCIFDYVNLRAGNGKLRVDAAEIAFGAKDDYFHGGLMEATGTGNIWANEARINNVKVNEINSLFEHHHDALRLQKDKVAGEVIIGKRARYNPDGSGVLYEISDGELTAQHVQAQDFTCADCGGSLSQILPKWRHMGTYFVNLGAMAVIPKPVCEYSRTRFKNRPTVGDNPGYSESWQDNRYEPKIVVIPKQMSTSTGSSGQVGVQGWNFRASDNGASWIAQVDTQSARGTALAKTYCVFTGGNASPTSWDGPIQHPDDSSTADSYFNVIE